MTPEAIALVQQSFAKVKPIAPQAGLLFYQNLFHIAPELRPLFKADVSDQGRKLMDMLAIAVGMLNQPQRLAEAVTQLGTRHSDYGVEMAHFKPVGTGADHDAARRAGERLYASGKVGLGGFVYRSHGGHGWRFKSGE